jgi:O-antigen ligase
MSIIIIYYAIFLCFSTISIGFVGLFIALYRLFEWFLIIFMVSTYISPSISPYSTNDTPVDRFATLVRIISTTAITITVGAIAIVPDLAVISDENIFRIGGYVYHPQMFGVLCGMGAAAYLYRPTSRIAYILAFIHILFLFLAYSRTAIAGAVGAFAVSFLLQRGVLRLPGLLLAVICGGAVVTLNEEIQQVLIQFFTRGTPEHLSTLNSRVFFWELAVDSIAAHPLFGTGFIIGPRSLFILASDRIIGHAHNDVINAAVAGGILSGVLTLLIHFRIVFGTLFGTYSSRTRTFLANIAIQGLFISFTEPLFSTVAYAPAIILLSLLRSIVATRYSHEALEKRSYGREAGLLRV